MSFDAINENKEMSSKDFTNDFTTDFFKTSPVQNIGDLTVNKDFDQSKYPNFYPVP